MDIFRKIEKIGKTTPKLQKTAYPEVSEDRGIFFAFLDFPCHKTCKNMLPKKHFLSFFDKFIIKNVQNDTYHKIYTHTSHSYSL